MVLQEFIAMAKRVTQATDNIRLCAEPEKRFSSASRVPEPIIKQFGLIVVFLQGNIGSLCGKEKVLIVYNFQPYYTNANKNIEFYSLDMCVKPIEKIDDIEVNTEVTFHLIINGKDGAVYNTPKALLEIDRLENPDEPMSPDSRVDLEEEDHPHRADEVLEDPPIVYGCYTDERYCALLTEKKETVEKDHSRQSGYPCSSNLEQRLRERMEAFSDHAHITTNKEEEVNADDLFLLFSAASRSRRGSPVCQPPRQLESSVQSSTLIVC